MIVKQVPDEQVGQKSLVLGIVLYEPPEAETLIELDHQTPHPLHPLHELRLPFAELLAAGVAAGESLTNGVGRHLAGLEREQHAGGVKRIEKAEGIADEHPAIAGGLFGSVG